MHFVTGDQLLFRKDRESDLKELTAFVQKHRPSAPTMKVGNVARMNDCGLLVIAYRVTYIVGYGYLLFQRTPAFRMGRIADLFVEASRDDEIGIALMQYLIKAAEREQLCQIVADDPTQDAKLRAIYENLGFATSQITRLTIEIKPG